MMRMLLAFAVVGMLAAPAMARPDLPPHVFRADVSNRMAMAQDGRGMTAMEHVDRPAQPRPSMVNEAREAHAQAWNALADRHARFTPPMKTQIQMKMHKGDNITGEQHQVAGIQSSQVKVQKDRYGRALSHFAPPVKSQIALRMHKGDDLLGSASTHGAAAKPADSTANKAHPLSKKEKTDLCKQTGVCIPYLQGSDDPSDKVE